MKNPRYLPYSIFLIILVFIGTFTALLAGDNFQLIKISDNFKDVLLFIELSAAIAYVLTGLFLGRLSLIPQMAVIIVFTSGMSALLWFGVIPKGSSLAILVSAFFYILWIVISALSAFGLFKEMFDNDIVGTIMFLGKPEDDGKVLFSLIGWTIVLINAGLGIMIRGNGIEDGSTALTTTGIIIIAFSIVAAIPLLNLQKKYDVFWTILNLFFMFAFLRVLLLAFRSITETTGQTSFWDTLFSLFMALFAIQYAAARGIKLGNADDIELEVDDNQSLKERTGLSLVLNRLFSDRGTILIILGIVIGYHTMQVQTLFGRTNIFQYIAITEDADIVLLGYEVYLASALFIYILVFLIFNFFPSMREYMAPEIKRIPWAPPYEDLKILVSSIKEGEISWKADVVKLVGGLAYEKMKGKFGRGSKENRVQSTLGRLIRRAKDKDENE